ncbi:MAG: hypothetical protein WBG32_14600 [Nodosilinea sp.]
MRDRPILAKHRGPTTATSTIPATGGEDLTPLILEADVLRIQLGYQRWADLKPLCNGQDPKTLDRRALVSLIGLLGKEQREQHHGK